MFFPTLKKNLHYPEEKLNSEFTCCLWWSQNNQFLSPAYSLVFSLAPFLFLNSTPSSHTTKVHIYENPDSPSTSCFYTHMFLLFECSLGLAAHTARAGFASRFRDILEEVCGSEYPEPHKREGNPDSV